MQAGWRPVLVCALWRVALGQPLCWRPEQPDCRYALATLATKPTLREFELFVRTLHRFDARRKLYVGTDTAAGAWAQAQRIHAVDATPCLVRYEAYDRNWMKHNRWGGLTVWTHLQLEKTTIMARAFDDGWTGVLYADCDVAWLAPLPSIGAGVVGLSPCLCAPRIEARYGKYNGGHVFARSRDVLDVWRNATPRSRYFRRAEGASEDGSRRRRGCHVDIPWRRVAATPRLRRGYSAETTRTPQVRNSRAAARAERDVPV